MASHGQPGQTNKYAETKKTHELDWHDEVGDYELTHVT
jgi:hypothetical protein